MANQPKRYKKFVATAATATLVASAIVPAASAASYNDVDEKNDHKKNIEAISELGYMGAGDNFRPYESLKRSQVAIILANWAQDVAGLEVPADYKTVQYFKDLPLTADDKLLQSAALVKKYGIFEGSNGNLNGNDAISRQHMALVLNKAYKAVHGTSLEELAGDTSDVVFADESSINKDYLPVVKALKKLGITAPASFNPNGNVTRGQFATFFMQTVNAEAPDAEFKVESVSAITSKTAKVTFNRAMGELSTEDFNVNGGLSVVDVELSADKKSATVTFSKDMVDGAEYTLQLLDENGDAVSEKSFKYVLGEVDSIALTKNVFEVGENVKNFLKVYDDKGVEISTADYNVVGVESSNTTVVAATGAVAGLGTANLRLEIEYKDGSRTKSDFIRVDVEQAVTAALAGFELAATPSFDNTVDYRTNASDAKSFFYKSDAAEYLYVYADDSKTNPEVEELDLSTGGDYKVTSKSPTVVTASQDATGALLTPISVGKATIEITGPNGYKKTVTVEVKEDPKFKDILVGATSVKLSDEAVGGTDLGVNQAEVTLEWIDQHGNKRDLAEAYTGSGSLTGTATNTSGQEKILTDVIVPGDKVVISTTANAFAIEDLTTGDSEFFLTAVQGKTVSNATVRVSYYADANASRATVQKTIATSVVDVDATKPAANYETLITNSAIDAYGTNNTATVTAYAVDAKGNRIDDVTSNITLSFADSVSVSERKWFDITTATNKATFATDAWKYMTETGAIKLEYTVAGSSNPHGATTINYTNSFAAPAKAVVSTSPVLIDTAATGDFAAGISVEELLFGKIVASSPELVIDDNPADTSIAIKKGFDGYANKPALSFLDKNGKAVVTGAGLYGLVVSADETGNGYLIDTGAYDADTLFEVEYVITNDKDLVQSSSTPNDLGNTLTVATGEDQASLTLVITKVTVKGDPRVNNAGTPTAKNLLDAPKSFNVIIK